MVKGLFSIGLAAIEDTAAVNKRHQLAGTVLPGPAPAFTARDDQAAPFTDVAANLAICSFLQDRFPDEILVHAQ